MKKILLFILLFAHCELCLAWKFKEHQDLGTKAYEEACIVLDEVILGKNSEDSKKIERELYFMLCDNLKERAKVYGLRTAISGDHVASPKDFSNIDGEINSASWINYGNLAKENEQHFWPNVKKNWSKYHLESLDISSKARREWEEGNTFKAMQTLEESLIHSAFSNHFLQDAFSVGHGGFSRVNSLQNMALDFHDFWNEKGRIISTKSYFQERDALLKKIAKISNVKNGKINFYHEAERVIACRGSAHSSDSDCPEKKDNKKTNGKMMSWLAYGDGYLDKNPNKPPEGGGKRDLTIEDESSNTFDVDNKEYIVFVNMYAILAVFAEFIYESDNNISIFVANAFPVAFEYTGVGYVDTLFFDIGEDGYYLKQENFKSFNHINDEEDCGGDVKTFVIYPENYRCWFDLENNFMEPVYPNISIGISNDFLSDVDSMGYSIYLAYSPYIPSGIFENWPKWLRFYVKSGAFYNKKAYRDKVAKRYAEMGFNFNLPNFYNGSLFSHSVDLSTFNITTSNSPIERGLYAGLNTNMDILKVQVSLNTGFTFNFGEYSQPNYKIGILVTYNFGSFGGGPLSRWND